MITITAATGRYGRLVVDALLRHGVPASDIVAAVRRPAAAADLAARGVEIREADYDRPETLVPALQGADRLLLVPSADLGQRHPQMRRAIDAAIEAQVSLIAYASFINTGTSRLLLGEEHKLIEVDVRASGLPFVLLRHGAYTELYAGEFGDIAHALQTGTLIGSAGNGRVSGATRADLAEAAAVVLSSDRHRNQTYELGGDAFSMDDIAAEVTRQTGREVRYQDMPVDRYADALAASGMPAPFAQVLADTSLAVSRGDWHTDSNDLERLIGRAPTSLATVIAEHLPMTTSSSSRS